MLNGHLLNDRYRILEKIGGGGMADVYLAKDIILDRKVAIKVLRLEYANDDEFIARFDREAQSATSLSHPNVVTIFDVGEEDQILYMVMEYVDGMTLKEFIQRYGPIDVPEAIEIMKQISAAITHAHENGIVHRDIKPQNILIDTYGHIKVTDFGIAIALSATSLTQTNSILGSVHYLSPEQARGGMATKKSDIYSLGILFFEMLTGRLPFSGQSPVSIALKHLQSETPSIRRFIEDVPQSVENIVLKATAKDPFHRYDTVFDMEEALDVALSPDKINEPKYTPPVEVGEETKAIPIITENQLENIHQDTIIHQTNIDTKKISNGQVQQDETSDQIKKKNKKTKKKKKKWLIISIVLLTLITIALVFIFLIPGLNKPREMELPNFVEYEYEEAYKELSDLGLDVKREDMYSEEIEEGLVIKTYPRQGRTVREGDTITLYVSQGKEKVDFDDFVGEQYRDAERLLIEKGYIKEDIVVYEEFSDLPIGEIISQNPLPGAKVVPEETTIIFEVSKGKEPITLGKFEGTTPEEAKRTLEAQGLFMEVREEHSDSMAEGMIIRQDPEPNSKVNEGDTVIVYVSLGKEEIPPYVYEKTILVEYTLDEQDNSEGEDGENNTNQEPIPQEIRLHIQDMNNPDLAEVFWQDTITEDKYITIELMIEHGSQGKYQVFRDNQVIQSETIQYKGDE
ncbi:Stk1 family PASTA domain-containing Ser/Thr kinase [Ornithinibacillus halotolerans]|uniref:Serine/threonine-protein kinase PrkC n=1 Tax=Ornithinibacillus halotolerans TaxID=1274357 RepID=A0A916S5D0_9BACI|nr:Stk1 family PASTA domain-containing Ser/Thr kinase [Ornithinibacillus halotolerans]GGA84201.1 serine/threonine-protein kinase PrkC [Ornithinibacillus halotolerans]